MTSPLVDWLGVLRIPRAAGAALVLGTLVAGASWATVSLGDDAAAIVASLPEAARKVRQHGREAQATGPNALQKILRAAYSVITSQDDLIGNAIEDTVVGEVHAGSNWIVRGESNVTNGWLNLQMR